ncbi:MAG TPA: hypothetical protein VL200_12135 [Lacunisphaera sp.]|jgi:hypothetical protein|nr:hypothetical protein [Lacunisphaera sp.]
MNLPAQLPRTIALALLVAILVVVVTRSARAAERVGTYDSRAVAFAAFWDEANHARLVATIQAAREAQARGDTARHRSLASQLAARQHQLHMQVFSTAPVDDVLASLGDRLPELRRAAGVVRLVSQWDAAALARVPAADRVDMTDRLIAEFHVPAAQLKVLAALRAAPPMPRWKVWFLSKLDLV